MKASDVQTNNNSVGFCGLLALLFIAFKLAGIIAWSWWWVLSPIWIPALIALALIAVLLVVIIIVKIISLLPPPLKRGPP